MEGTGYAYFDAGGIISSEKEKANYYYIYSVCFSVVAYATYRWENQPLISLEYSYYNDGNWSLYETRTIEGGGLKRETFFGHNITGSQSFSEFTNGDENTVFFDNDHSNKHLWQIRTERLRDGDYGNGRIRLFNPKAMSEEDYNNFLRGKKIKGLPKTSLTVDSDLNGDSIILLSENSPLPAVSVYNYFHTGKSRGSYMSTNQNWRATVADN